MRISASQDSTYSRCQRLWYFRYVLKAPVKPKDYLDFGTVLHGVCERFLLADDLGRVPFDRPEQLHGQIAGQPVDLFPDGWDTVEGRRISPVESSLIQKLVDRALTEGTLERSPNQEIEYWFDEPLIDEVRIVGKIDVLGPDQIQDHKSTKDMQYALSQARLAEDTQCLTYAKIALDRDPSLQEVRLRHNTYCKDPKALEVRRIEARATRSDIRKNWLRLQSVAAEMLELSKTRPEWQQVEGPSSPGACGAFGGCSFRPVCGGKESLPAYRQRVQRQIENWKPVQKIETWDDVLGKLPATPSTRSDNTVDIFQKRLAAKGQTASPAAPAASQINGGAAVAETPAPAKPAGDAPPWAVAGCGACKGSGFNSNGNPCRICDSNQRKVGGPTSIQYVVAADADGNVTWTPKEGQTGGGKAPLPETSKPKATVRATPAEALAQDPGPDPVETPVLPPVQEKGKKAKKKGGRRPRGFRIYIDAVPLGVATTMAESLFDELGAEMAQAQGVGSYFDLDPFKRREAWRKAPLSERLGTSEIVVRKPNGSPDLQAFIEALKSQAQPGNVVEGLS